jgi:hypothetical protein
LSDRKTPDRLGHPSRQPEAPMKPFTEVQLNPENLRQPRATEDQIDAQTDELEAKIGAVLDRVAAPTVGETGELRFSILAPPEEVAAAFDAVDPEWEAEGIFSLIEVE